MTTAGIDNSIMRRNFDNLVASGKAAAFAQISKHADFGERYLSERGKDAAARIASVTLNQARTPGFLKATESKAIIEYAAGRTDAVPTEAIEAVNRRSEILSSVKDAGKSQPGGRMGLKYAVPAGTLPLDEAAQSKMAVVTRFLNRSLNEYRSAFTGYRESTVAEREGASMRLVWAEEEVINDSEVYLLARNDLASQGYDVSNFDKNAESRSLMVLAVRRYELDSTRDRGFNAKAPAPAVKSSTLSM